MKLARREISFGGLALAAAAPLRSPRAQKVKLDGAATVAQLQAMPTDHDCFGPGSIRVDGRKIHPSHLWK